MDGDFDFRGMLSLLAQVVTDPSVWKDIISILIRGFGLKALANMLGMTRPFNITEKHSVGL